MSFQCPGVLSPPTYSHNVSTSAAMSVPAPSPLSADQSMCGKAQEEDGTEAPGMLASKRKGKEVYLFLFHTPSPLMASACFPKFNHLFREKDWNFKRSQNREAVHSRGTFPGTQGLIYKIYKEVFRKVNHPGLPQMQDRT